MALDFKADVVQRLMELERQVERLKALETPAGVDPSGHRHSKLAGETWRVRFNPDTLLFEESEDGINWTDVGPPDHNHIPGDISPQGAGSGLDADKTDGLHANASNVAGTLAARNGSGDVVARLFRPEYNAAAANFNYINVQIARGTGDNYIRAASLSEFKARVGIGGVPMAYVMPLSSWLINSVNTWTTLWWNTGGYEYNRTTTSISFDGSTAIYITEAGLYRITGVVVIRVDSGGATNNNYQLMPYFSTATGRQQRVLKTTPGIGAGNYQMLITEAFYRKPSAGSEYIQMRLYHDNWVRLLAFQDGIVQANTVFAVERLGDAV